VTERITVSISDETHEKLQARLEYGDNRSAIVDAALAGYLDKIEE